MSNDIAWKEQDWQVAFDERAGILEYDEGLPRARAEDLAQRQLLRIVGRKDKPSLIAYAKWSEKRRTSRGSGA